MNSFRPKGRGAPGFPGFRPLATSIVEITFVKTSLSGKL